MQRLFLLLGLAIGIALGAGFGEHWAYEDYGDEIHGPDTWYEVYPACGQGESTETQSPVDIPASETTLDPGLSTIEITYATSASLLALNKGYTIELDVPDADQDDFSFVDPWDETSNYKLAQFHFHWSDDDDVMGSEHAIDGEKFPVELHLVHYRSDFPNITAAVLSGEKNALSVLGVMFEIGEENAGLAAIVDALNSDDLHYEGDTVDVSDFDISEILPDTSIGDFFTYSGSLTTPSCDEVVQWVVIPHPLTMSQDQLDAFRSIAHIEEPEGSAVTSGEEIDVTCNARPLQPLNGRIVYQPYSAGVSAAPVAAMMLIAVMLVLL